MATTMCEIDGVRPAVATVRISQNGEERTIAVCEEHLRELQGRSRAGARSPFGGRSSLFDELFSDSTLLTICLFAGSAARVQPIAKHQQTPMNRSK